MEKRKKWIKRPAHLALALLLIAILGIGSTIAFFTDIEAAVNSIKFGNIKIETNEEVNGLTKTNIGVTATGKSECYVRMRVDVPTVKYEYTANGKVETGTAMVTYSSGGSSTVSGEKWNELQEPIKVLIQRADGKTSEKADWNKIKGFWYLSTTLNPGDSVKLIDSITYPGLWVREEGAQTGHMIDPLPDGLTFDMMTIPIVSEAVQAEGIDVGASSGSEAAYEAFRIVNN